MPLSKNLIIDQGATFRDHVVYQDKDKNPISLTGWTTYGQMQKSFESSNAAAVFNTSMANASNGNITMYIQPSETANIKRGRYIYSIDATDGSTTVRIVEGIVTVNPGAMATGTPTFSGSAMQVYATLAQVNALSTSNITEGGNLYYTNARVYANVISLLNAKANTVDLTTSNIVEGSNLYYTNVRVYANVIGLIPNITSKANIVDLTTSNVTEGTNLYYTNDRVYANVIGLIPNVLLKANTADLNTSNVTEGSNLYYTNARVYSNVISMLNGYVVSRGLSKTSANATANLLTTRTIFVDTNAAGGNVTILLPTTPAADGFEISVKHINSGGYQTVVATSNWIEDLSGSITATAVMANTGTAATWVYDSAAVTYRLVSHITR